MGYDFQRDKGAPNPMGWTAFSALSLPDQSRFCLSGGHVFEDRPEQLKPVIDPNEVITSRFGKQMLRTTWEALPVEKQAAFVMDSEQENQ